MDGLLIVDKPLGMTSHDVVARLRRLARTRKIGHAGTLDPLATGVLVLALGRATRLLEYLTTQEKQYQARVRLGQSTTTYDAEGAITAEWDGPWPDRMAVEGALDRLRGPQMQVPPPFSAIKQDGEPLYARARRGEIVSVPPRPVHIYVLTLLDYQPPSLELETHVSKGTYIRSLAHDLGAMLGVGAHLATLRRTASGPFGLGVALTLDALEIASEAGRLGELLLPPELGVVHLPEVLVDAEGRRALHHGRSIEGPPAEAGTVGRAMEAGELVAIVQYRSETDRWHPQKVFV